MLTFNGLRTIGPKKGNSTDATQTRASASWTACVLATDPPATFLNIPGFASTSGANSVFPFFKGWQYTLDATSIQSSFTFGAVKSIQLALVRQKAVASADGSTFNFIPSRVAVYISATGQLFLFSAKETVNCAKISNIIEAETFAAEIPAPTPGKIDVYIEQETYNGAAQVPSDLLINIVAFNFSLQAVGAL